MSGRDDEYLLPDAIASRAQRDGYLNGYRGVLGMVYLALVAT